MRRTKRSEPLITDPGSHPRQRVCLRVAAAFLGINERTVRSRIEQGDLPAWRDGKVYRIALKDLLAYHEQRKLTA